MGVPFEPLFTAAQMETYARAAVEASQSRAEAVEGGADICGPREHKWDRDGERCVNCGAKDWMGGECSGPREATPPESGGQGEAVGYVSQDELLALKDGVRLTNLWAKPTGQAGTPLYTHQPASAAVTEAMVDAGAIAQWDARKLHDSWKSLTPHQQEGWRHVMRAGLEAALSQGGKP